MTLAFIDPQLRRWSDHPRSLPGLAGDRVGQLALEWIDGLGRRDLEVVQVAAAPGELTTALGRYGSVALARRVGAELRPAPLTPWSTSALRPLEPASFDVAVWLDGVPGGAAAPAVLSMLAGLVRPGGSLVVRAPLDASRRAFHLAIEESGCDVESMTALGPPRGRVRIANRWRSREVGATLHARPPAELDLVTFGRRRHAASQAKALVLAA